MRGPARTRARRDGFTLIEVVLSLGLLLLGATAILGLLSFGAALARTAELRSLSAAAADAVVLDLEETLFPLEPDGGAGEPEAVVDRPVPGHPGLVYSARPSPRPDEGAGGPTREVRVDVEIRWKARGRPRTFSVLLLREVPFGERMRRSIAPPATTGDPGDTGGAPAPDEDEPDA